MYQKEEARQISNPEIQLGVPVVARSALLTVNGPGECDEEIVHARLVRYVDLEVAHHSELQGIDTKSITTGEVKGRLDTCVFVEQTEKITACLCHTLQGAKICENS